MKKIIVLLCLLLCSCSWFKKTVEPIVTDGINCVKAEEAAAAKGADVFHVLLQVGQALGDAAAAAVASGGDVIAALDAAAAPFIQAYGEPLVACVAQSLEPTPAPAGSGSSASAEAPGLAEQWIAHRHWTFAK